RGRLGGYVYFFSVRADRLQPELKGGNLANYDCDFFSIGGIDPIFLDLDFIPAGSKWHTQILSLCGLTVEDGLAVAADCDCGAGQRAPILVHDADVKLALRGLLLKPICRA